MCRANGKGYNNIKMILTPFLALITKIQLLPNDLFATREPFNYTCDRIFWVSSDLEVYSELVLNLINFKATAAFNNLPST